MWYAIYDALIRGKNCFGKVPDIMRLIPRQEYQERALLVALKHVKFRHGIGALTDLAEEEFIRMSYWGKKIGYKIRTGHLPNIHSWLYVLVPYVIYRKNGIVTYMVINEKDDSYNDKTTYPFAEADEIAKQRNDGKNPYNGDTVYLLELSTENMNSLIQKYSSKIKAKPKSRRVSKGQIREKKTT